MDEKRRCAAHYRLPPKILSQFLPSFVPTSAVSLAERYAPPPDREGRVRSRRTAAGDVRVVSIVEHEAPWRSSTYTPKLCSAQFCRESAVSTLFSDRIGVDCAVSVRPGYGSTQENGKEVCEGGARNRRRKEQRRFPCVSRAPASQKSTKALNIAADPSLTVPRRTLAPEFGKRRRRGRRPREGSGLSFEFAKIGRAHV